MQSKANDADAYFQVASPDRRQCLAWLRELCPEALAGYDMDLVKKLLADAVKSTGEAC